MLYKPNSRVSQPDPIKVNNMQKNPSTLNTEPPTLLHEGSDMACKYIAKAVHVINDNISKGSHDQYLPHALSAHAAPETIPNVSKGNPASTNLKDICRNEFNASAGMP